MPNKRVITPVLKYSLDLNTRKKRRRKTKEDRIVPTHHTFSIDGSIRVILPDVWITAPNVEMKAAADTIVHVKGFLIVAITSKAWAWVCACACAWAVVAARSALDIFYSIVLTEQNETLPHVLYLLKTPPHSTDSADRVSTGESK
jgi:hypothetical protein